MRKLQADLKILVGLGQVLQLVGSSLQLSIPSPFLELGYWFSFLSLDLFAVVNFQCTYAYNFIDIFVMRSAFPFVLIGLLYAVSRRNAARTSTDKHLREVFDEADEDDSGASLPS